MEANARFLSVFRKKIYNVKIIDLKKIRLNKVRSKVSTFVRKVFIRKFEVPKSFSSREKKIEKVQICQNAPRPLSPEIS
jgi:hypothetical protein